MTRIYFLAATLMSCIAIAGHFAFGVETSPQKAGPTSEELRGTEPYEILQPDASWCGPRVLYFFSVYMGKPCALDEVVIRCRADSNGLTSLADLSEAADSLGLVPTAVHCSVDDLAEFNGPAIVSLSRRQEGPVHFVGVLRREQESFVVLDPSVSVRTYRVSRPFLEESFTGHAILLGETGRMRTRWLSIPGTLLLSACWIALVGGILWPSLPARVLSALPLFRREGNYGR